MGVLFEPYAFDDNIKDYGFYVLAENSDADIEPFGVYEDYSKLEFYSSPASALKAVFTEPYDDQGCTMVTYSVPIIYNNELKGEGVIFSVSRKPRTIWYKLNMYQILQRISVE